MGAQRKGDQDDDGDPTIRLLQDGTFGVKVNTRISVLDKTRSPAAPDIKRGLREQARRSSGSFGLAADISEAHRIPQVDEQDWPLQATQLERGRNVFIHKVGCFGIASAAY
jgi:hypothetical protein